MLNKMFKVKNNKIRLNRLKNFHRKIKTLNKQLNKHLLNQLIKNQLSLKKRKNLRKKNNSLKNYNKHNK